MAFPTVSTSNSSTQTTTTTHTVSLPASIAANDLLIVVFVNEDDTTVTTPSGWTLLKSRLETGAATLKVTIFYKVASGSEGSTLSVTTSSSRVSSHASYRITGYTGTPEVSTATSSTSGQTNPDSLTPAGGAKDYLWIAVSGKRNTTTSGYPTNYASNQKTANISGALGGCNVAIATYNLNTTSQDPDTFSHADAGYWVGCTIAVSGTGSASSKFALLGVG